MNIGQGGFYLKRNNFFRVHIHDNSAKYILGIILTLAGVCTGCAVMMRLPADRAQALVAYFSESAAKGETVAFTRVFKSSLISNMKYLLLYFVLSLTVYSSWLCVAIPGYKGFAAGFTAVFLIRNYGAHGVAYTMLAIVPSTALIIPVYLFTSAVCINFATDRRKRGEVGARAALGMVPALMIVYAVMAVFSLYDVIVAPAIFRSLF